MFECLAISLSQVHVTSRSLEKQLPTINRLRLHTQLQGYIVADDKNTFNSRRSLAPLRDWLRSYPVTPNQTGCNWQSKDAWTSTLWWPARKRKHRITQNNMHSIPDSFSSLPYGVSLASWQRIAFERGHYPEIILSCTLGYDVPRRILSINSPLKNGPITQILDNQIKITSRLEARPGTPDSTAYYRRATVRSRIQP